MAAIHCFGELHDPMALRPVSVKRRMPASVPLRQSRTTWHRIEYAVAALVVAALFGGCRQTLLPDPKSGHQLVETCPTPDSADFFFPAGYIQPAHDLTNDTFFRRWYSEFLRASNVGPLWCGPDKAETYRLLWLPTYRPAMVISIASTSRDWKIQKVVFADPRERVEGGSDVSVRVVSRDEFLVPDAPARVFLDALEAADFWTAPHYVSSGVDDGHFWVVEGRKGTTYRVSTRHSADDLKFEDAVRVLTRLARAKVPPEMEPREP